MAINVNLPIVTESYTNLASFPSTGSTSILYKALNDNKLYTWDETKYNEVDKKFASSWGSVAVAPETTAITKDEVGLGNVDNTADLDKPVSTATQTALNAKQDTLVSSTNIKTINSTSLLGSGDVAVQPTLVSGTNIKTINGSSVLGSGDLVVSGGGASGIHAPFVVSGGSYSYGVNANLLNSGTSMSNNQMRLVPFKPRETFTCSALYINCTLLFAGNLARILIYSDLNNVPNTKLFESANLDLSTIGIKTATTSFTFNAGTTYWICTHTSGSTANLTILPNTAVYPIRIGGISNPSTYVTSQIGYAIGSAPTTMGAINYNSGSVFYVGITAV